MKVSDSNFMVTCNGCKNALTGKSHEFFLWKIAISPLLQTPMKMKTSVSYVNGKINVNTAHHVVENIEFGERRSFLRIPFGFFVENGDDVGMLGFALVLMSARAQRPFPFPVVARRGAWARRRGRSLHQDIIV